MLLEKYMPLKKCKTVIVIFLLQLSVVLSYGQYSKEFLEYSSKYPDSHKVRLSQESVVTIKNNNGVLDIKQEFFEEDLFLNEFATQNSKGTIRYSSFFDLEKIEASSFTFIEDKYKEFKVKEFKEKDDLNESFYDDSRIVNFIYDNIQKGSKSTLKYSQKIKNPRFLSPFYFGDYYPIIYNKVTFIVEKGIDIEFKKFNIYKENIEFFIDESRNKTTYTWILKNKDKYEYEPGAPTYKTILPHIVPLITSYNFNGQTQKVLGNTSDLYNWYYSLVKDINKEEPDKELKDLVKSITENKPNELEKVRAIYYWAQNNIKYIAFEYALGGFIPRESNEVFRKKYGDCKDNSSIMYKMFEIAGIKGNLTWIGTRSIPYKYDEMPTPIVDNHMILSYENNGKTYYLDATGRFIKLELPTSFIQGKEALISNGENFVIKTVPIVSAKENAEIDSTFITIENEIIKGKSTSVFSGYRKIDFFQDLEIKKNQSDLKQFYNTQLSKGNNKFLIDDFKEINKYEYDKEFKVNYNFKIQDYFKNMGKEIFINLNLNKKASDLKIDKKRKNDIEYDYKKYYNFTTTLQIPDNYKIEYLPENISFSDELLKSEISYQTKGNQIIYNHSLELNYLLLNKEQQEKVNNIINKIEKNYKEIIILKKI